MPPFLENNLPFYDLDDESFQLALFESHYGRVNFDPDRLSSLNYNPLFTNTNRHLTLSGDLDPDSNFYPDSNCCNYYIEDQFNEMFRQRDHEGNNFSILHLNIRSLQSNFNNLTDFLSNLDIKFSIIGITETWLQDAVHSVDIDGYNFIHKHRSNRSGGGVGLYLSNELEFKIRGDLIIDEVETAESLFIEIVTSQGKNIIVGVIYRPPNSNVSTFLIKYNELIGKISRENKECYIIGDFNLNLMNYQRHSSTGEFLDGMYTCMFFPLITRPSRLTSHTSTLIDNIFTNHFSDSSKSGLLFTDISDHLPVFFIRFRDSPQHKPQEVILVRDKNQNNVDKFKEQLEDINWSLIEGYDDPHKAYNGFLKKYSETYNACFPLRKVKAKLRFIRKPWISTGLRNSIKRKNKLYRSILHNPNQQHERFYKDFRNKLNHLLRIAKRLYYERKLEETKSDIKATWKILNEIINKKHRKTKTNSKFIIDNKEISDPIEIADRFCDYFTNVGPNLARKIQPSSSTHLDYVLGSFPNSLFLNPTSESEVIEVTNNFQSGKAAGYDNIPMSIIKQSIGIISAPLTHIINLSISHGVVPDQMKIARVIPLYKADDKSVLTNYRPISILPSFSKILERIVYNRLTDHINKFNILSDNQYGFRKNRSTSLALIDLYEKISLAFDRKEFAVGIFLDLSKAFDTVNHNILFEKLDHYGIRGLALDWIKSYFFNRLQFVQFDNYCSSRKNICCGVPQGSILGPLFFLLYINDLNNVSMLLNFILFADDTNVFFAHRDPKYLIEILELELSKLSNWFSANMLSLNLKKTKYLIFKPRQKQCPLNTQLHINNQQIEQVSETIFLGVILDEHLSWKSHISRVANKISKSAGIIFKSSFYLFKSSLRALYFSMIYPYLQYCNIVWASTYITNLRRIILLQKRVVRILNKAKFDAHTEPIFKELNLLKFQDIRLLQLGQFMFSFRTSTLPTKFNNLFTTNNQIHNYNTRSSQKLHTPLCRLNTRKFSIAFQGAKLFNSLTNDIVNTASLSLFKKKLKTYLCNKY